LITGKPGGYQMSTQAELVSLMVYYNNMKRNLGHLKMVTNLHQPEEYTAKGAD